MFNRIMRFFRPGWDYAGSVAEGEYLQLAFVLSALSAQELHDFYERFHYD